MARYWVATLLALALVVLVGGRLESLNTRLGKGDPSLKILAIELADEPRAKEIAALWHDVLDVAYESLALDLLFIAAYTALFVMLCSLAYSSLRRSWPNWAELGALIGWFALLAGVLDIMENAAIFTMLRYERYGAADVCRLFATAKFVLIAIILAWLLTTLAAVCVSRAYGVLRRA